MQHWPEQINALYGKYLFSSDFFGQHLASTERWADQFDYERVTYRLIDYAANIMCPYLNAVRKTAAFYN